MGGIPTRLLALLLIAFVAMSAQCVASCSVESALAASQPPCHKSPTKAPCAHDQAARDSGKLIQVERPAAITVVAAAVPASPHEPLPAPLCQPASPPPLQDLLSSTVLRI